ncbi:hypothetical protein BDW74DRAFT_178078 [Aspergillus multicolor]|uniref:lipase family protein n=1 Tax=Aspergillus multicolor TaxID=41759 RepID=UPI003CCDC221
MIPGIAVIYAAGLLLLWLGPSGAQDIDEALLERFNIFSQYAGASGCDQNNNSTASFFITCDFGCPRLTDYNVTTLFEFQNRGLGDVTGFLGLDNFRKLIVLVFRGSTSSQNSRADLNFLAYWDWLLCWNCYVHAGFWASWKSVEGDVLYAIRMALQQYPDYQLVFTGHSLGGAVATMGATLFTFGAPKIGNAATARRTTELTRLYRATHKSDPVPKLPLTWGFPYDYSQPSPEYWVTAEFGDDVTLDDISYVEGINSQNGIAAAKPANVSVHMLYFGSMTVCEAPSDQCHGNIIQCILGGGIWPTKV